MAKTGVYSARKKDGSIYYRASITHKCKHISLGSFATEAMANAAYREADDILRQGKNHIDAPEEGQHLSYEKVIILLNLRDNGIYFKTPIYLRPRHFEYYLSPSEVLKFDRDDLFFYAQHKIQQRQGRLFVCDYGSQYGILTRYGIRNYAVAGRDFRFVNGDIHDYRYENLQVINQYMGVQKKEDKGIVTYETNIHVNGNYRVGLFQSESDAAIAYNKAVDYLAAHGSKKQYVKNYIVGMDKKTYQKRYAALEIFPFHKPSAARDDSD